MRALPEAVPIPESWRALGLHVGASRDPATSDHLSHVLDTFFAGYGETLRRRDPIAAVARLPAGDRGWAWEGVAMAMTLGGLMTDDDLAPTFGLLGRHAQTYLPLVYAGVGYAFGRLRRPLSGPPEGADPLWGWMAVDGYAFYLALRRPRRYVERAHPAPDETVGAARRVLYQGLGRSIWFTRAGDPERIAQGIDGLPAEHRGDLWRGVGVAMAYTGRVADELVRGACERAGAHARDLGVGVAVATHTRDGHGEIPPWNAAASRIACRRDVPDLVALTHAALDRATEQPRFPAWCDAIGAQLGD